MKHHEKLQITKEMYELFKTNSPLERKRFNNLPGPLLTLDGARRPISLGWRQAILELQITHCPLPKQLHFHRKRGRGEIKYS